MHGSAENVESAGGPVRIGLVRHLHGEFIKGYSIDAAPLSANEIIYAMFGEPIQLPDLHPFGNVIHHAAEHIPHPSSRTTSNKVKHPFVINLLLALSHIR